MVALLVALFIVTAFAIEVFVVRRGAVPEPVSANGPLPMRAPQPPDSVFLTKGHTWARMTTEGTVRVGIDDVVAQALGDVESIWVPQPGTRVKASDPIMKLMVRGRALTIAAPGDGVVESFNDWAVAAPWVVAQDPYRAGWVVSVTPDDYEAMIAPLRMGASAIAYLRGEMTRLVEFVTAPVQLNGAPVLADGGLPMRGAAARLDDRAWDEFQSSFVHTA